MKTRLIVFVGTCFLLGWLFAPALVGSASFAFRDAAHYYRPQFDFIRQEWLAGRVPLWNPHENLGVPLVAENTSSVFYPGKLVFALPFNYPLLYHGYIVLHVILAAATSYRLARHFGGERLGAGLAAVSYAFGGSVLFQYCNVVFLVGAAWLPLALLCADRMLRTRSAGGAVGLGVTLGLMVLGGDPQMAVNAVLLSALYGLMFWREEKCAAPHTIGPAMGPARRRATLLGVAILVAGLLAAVQVLPTLEAAPASSRAHFDAPRNVYELAAWSLDGSAPAEKSRWYDGLLGRTSGGHERQIYQFSIAPWRAVELVWPNVTGRAFPTNRRWLDALVPEGDLWTPTLYLGLLPIVLAAVAWSVRRSTPVEARFVSWLVVIGSLASLGVYGIAWGVRVLFGGAELGGVGDEVGGLYWWLNVLVPKYAYFRYPAKWFVIASLGLAMLAARGWGQMWRTDGGGVRRILIGLAVGSFAGYGAAVLGFGVIERRGAGTSPDPILGPLDWSGASWDVRAAFVQSGALALVFLAAVAIARSKPRWSEAARRAAFGITLVDLAIAQGYLVLYAPEEYWRAEPKALAMLPGEPESYRVFRQREPRPPSWSQSSSPQRYAECVRWDRDTFWPKYNLPYRVGIVEASQTMAPADYRALLDVARRYALRERKGRLPDDSILDLLAARVAIVGVDWAGQISAAESVAEGMVIGQRPSALPRAWIVHRVQVVPEFTAGSRAGLEKFTEELLFPNGQPRNWRETAVVETDDKVEFGAVGDKAVERCAITYADPLRVEIDATLSAPGLVVLCDQYSPGWQLTAETGGQERLLPILRTNRVMRGAVLPAGTHRLVYRYRPTSVVYGGTISALAWLALVALGVFVLVRGRRQIW